MVRCKVCRNSVIKNRCTNCGAFNGERIKSDSKDANPDVEKKVSVHIPREAPPHGFRRFGAAFEDEEISRLCEETAQQVPVGHPAERVANAVADMVVFVKTPGGKAAVQGLKRTLQNFFAE